MNIRWVGLTVELQPLHPETMDLLGVQPPGSMLLRADGGVKLEFTPPPIPRPEAVW